MPDTGRKLCQNFGLLYAVNDVDAMSVTQASPTFQSTFHSASVSSDFMALYKCCYYYYIIIIFVHRKFVEMTLKA